MKVVLDARWITENPSGIGIYTQELLSALPRLAPDWEFTLLFNSTMLAQKVLLDADLAKRANVKVKLLSYGVFSPLGQVKLPIALRRGGYDIFHSPNYMLPYAAFPRRKKGRVACVCTIHDVIPLILPDHAPKSRKQRLYPLFVQCLRESVMRSDAVLTVSESSRDDLIKFLQLREEDSARISVVHNGVAESFYGKEMKSILKDRTSERTLLYVGRLDPYKNVPLLVEAFAAARRELPFPLRLKIVCALDPRYPEAVERANQLGVGDRVHFTGPLSEKELIDAYREADLLAHPSRYEGFGLQLLEAMASGLPVLCTDGGSQPEVVGDAAQIVPSDNPAELSAQIVELLTSPARLKELRKQGLERAAYFSWGRATNAVLDCYKSLT